MSAESSSHAPRAKPERQHSLWESPDRSLAIYLTFEVIDAINLALTQIATALPVRGAEIGGLLLGKSEHRGRLTVWIDQFEPVPCSYARGASWMLSDGEREELAQRLAQTGDAQVVGFFRSHTRKDLFLSEDDVDLFGRVFADPSTVFLLVKPFTTRTNMGGFFYWEGGSIERTASRLEFPFHRRELGGGEPVAVTVPPPDAWVRQEEVPQETLHEAAVPNDGSSGPMFLRHKPQHVGSLLRKLAIALGAIVVCAGGYTAYKYFGGRPSERTMSRQTPRGMRAMEPPAGTLRLTASAGEKNITLTWDRTSPIIAAATRGTVEILEGTFHKELDMNPEELRSGRVVYSRPEPISDTVSFRMHLNTGQGEPFTEAVRYVSRDDVSGPPGSAPKAAPSEASTPKMRVPPSARVPASIGESNAADAKTALEALPAPRVEAPKVAPPKLSRPAPRREP